MLKLGWTKRATGTRVLCPACRYPNLGIDIWCERCGGPMESSPAGTAIAASPPEAATVPAAASLLEAPIGPTMPAINWPRLTVPSIKWPQLQMPPLIMPKPRLPRISRLVLVVAAVLAVLLIAPLAYVLLPGIRPVPGRGSSGVRQATSAATSAANSPEAVAIAGVKAKTGLPYAARCATSGPCLTMAGQSLGQDAATVLFSTAGSGGRQCVGYVYRAGASWHFLDALCGLPGQLSPLVGRDATVHIPGNCANVRDQASLNGTVVACLHDGTTVHVDGGPNYADGRLWWHEMHGWIAHDFLTGP